ncbi:zinc finger protein 436-like [Bombina bombina]|uniref:zinc finger protein 436-like n=1 Tax=Bombina bombina TaxID=8345 RepID=UPI00235ABCFC|nr:zinc finger protein 436-like [Bombina bombina]
MEDRSVTTSGHKVHRAVQGKRAPVRKDCVSFNKGLCSEKATSPNTDTDAKEGPDSTSPIESEHMANISLETTWKADHENELNTSITQESLTQNKKRESRESRLQSEHIGGGIICPDCGKTFQSQHLFTKHQRTHSGKRLFTCSACGKRFGHHSSLFRHRKSHCHPKTQNLLTSPFGFSLTEMQLYKCGICNEIFPGTKELRKHLTSHTGEQRYICKDCGRLFSCNYFLVRHQRTHTGEQPYQCKVCQRAFSQKTSLVIHLRIHTGDRPYPCQLCDRKFCSRSSMVRHHRSHKEQRSRTGGCAPLVICQLCT